MHRFAEAAEEPSRPCSIHDEDCRCQELLALCTLLMKSLEGYWSERSSVLVGAFLFLRTKHAVSAAGVSAVECNCVAVNEPMGTLLLSTRSD